MPFVCVACGVVWDPAHMCQGMLDQVHADARLAQIRGEKSFVFDRGSFAVPAPDKAPSIQELDHRLRPRPWK
jgi:hypothetical protein